jgi:hypothetical protein
MKKTTLFLALVTLAAFGWTPPPSGPTRGLKEEKMVIEYTVTENEAVVRIKAETEHSLDQVELRSPDGRPMLEMRASAGRRLPLSGFELETREVLLSELLELYPEGLYDIRGLTVVADPVRGNAYLSPALLRPPFMVYPRTGDVDVPIDDMIVRWRGEPRAAAYEVVLEQDDNDGLTVTLDGRAREFRVPAGILRSGVETFVEIVAIAPNGNRTAVEVVFTTR